MTDLLIQKIQKIDFFSQEEIDEFQGYLEKKFIRKGEHFLNLNQVSRYIAFVDSGLSMNYSLHDGMEIPRYFALEGDWIGSIKSFSTGSPSELAIKALEDTWIREISAEQMQHLFASSPRWLNFYNQIVQGVFFTITQQHADFAMLDAKERYYKFMREKPDLLNRIPQYYIAAYLGIKPQSLSRIRKEG